MKPAICEKHGVQQFVITSPRLAMAIAQETSIAPTEIRKLQIESMDKMAKYFVDSKFLKEFHFNPAESTITLKNRDKGAKNFNDRLIIMKIVGRMKWVCPICLEEIVSSSN